MKWQTLFLSLLPSAYALDCSAKELEKYDFSSIRGVYSDELMTETPPTTTNSTFYFGICDTINQDVCPKDSEVCFVTTIVVDPKDKGKNVVSQVISFDSSMVTYAPYGKEGEEEGVRLSYKRKWGDTDVSARIDFVCSDDDKPVIIRNLTDDLTVKTKAACIKSKNNKDNKGRTDDSESWGWFTWIFIFLVLFLSFYIIGGAWYQYNKGISIDFQTALVEVLQNFVELLRGLPAFIREIIDRVTVGNRGEYSAV